MSGEVFEAYAANCAVIEPAPASVTAPQALTAEEAAVYSMLYGIACNKVPDWQSKSTRGRLRGARGPTAARKSH